MHKPPSGLTDFEPAPHTDLRALRTACHDAARRTRGRVVDVVLSTAEPNRLLSTVDLSRLAQAEHRELHPWKADTVGDVVLGHWD